MDNFANDDVMSFQTSTGGKITLYSKDKPRSVEVYHAKTVGNKR